ncbi:MAG TPA: hypothetical protein DDW59_07175, partial [Gammaproteobacteria bacterium]|nr:hypothetical protein [Gammaproteobacteria bacterium]
REYQGAFVAGLKSGEGAFSWPNGNRYVGSFAEDQRSGSGVFLWRDDTVYRGQFSGNKQHGYGVKELLNNVSELQVWREGEIVGSTRIAENEYCVLQHLQRAWMFSAKTCVNGLAHGKGVAVSLDGDFVVADGVFVLGQFVAGELIEIPPKVTSMRVGNSNG